MSITCGRNACAVITTYDRAGYVWSQVSPHPRTSQIMSSHFVQLDQPELVVDAIRQVAEAARP